MTINRNKKKIKIDLKELNPDTSKLLLLLNSLPILFIDIKNFKIMNYLSNIEFGEETFEEVMHQASKLEHIHLNLINYQRFENVCVLEINREDQRELYGQIKYDGYSSSLFEQEKFIEFFKLNNSLSYKEFIELFLITSRKFSDRQFIALSYQLILKRPIDWETRESLLNHKDPYPNFFWRTKILYDLIYSEEYKNLKNSIYDIINILIDSS